MEEEYPSLLSRIFSLDGGAKAKARAKSPRRSPSPKGLATPTHVAKGQHRDDPSHSAGQTVIHGTPSHAHTHTTTAPGPADIAHPGDPTVIATTTVHSAPDSHDAPAPAPDASSIPIAGGGIPEIASAAVATKEYLQKHEHDMETIASAAVATKEYLQKHKHDMEKIASAAVAAKSYREHALAPAPAPAPGQAKAQLESKGKGDTGTKSTKEMFGAQSMGDEAILDLFSKLGKSYFIVLLSVGLAIYIMNMPGFSKAIFGDGDDANLDSPNATHAERYALICKVLFYFHLLVVICYGAIIGVLYMLMSLWFEVVKERYPGVPYSKYFMFTIFQYGSIDDPKFLTDFYLSLAVILVFGYLFYIVYFRFVKDYFVSLSYPNYVDEENNPGKQEYEAPQKFLIFYGLSIMFILAFAIMIMNTVYVSNDITLYVFYTFFIFLLMFIMGLLAKYTLTNDSFKLSVWAIFLLVIISFNKLMAKGVRVSVQNVFNAIKDFRQK